MQRVLHWKFADGLASGLIRSNKGMKHGMIVMLGGVVKALAVAATISFAFSAQAAASR